MMRRALLALAVAALAGCGGGGSDPPAPAFALRWDRATYTAVIPPGGGTVSVRAFVIPSGSPLPPIVGVDISPRGETCSGYDTGNGPWFMNSSGVVPVGISISPDCTTGQYPTGPIRLTATMRIGAEVYTATADLVVTR